MSWVGAKHVHLEVCGSTNDEAMTLARAGAPHGTVVTAGAQTAGRGRAGRTWASPVGANLYLSLVVRAKTSPAITLAAGIATCDAVRAVGCPARIKWPNDILGERGKLGGILTEASGGVVVIGIGVNVAGELPRELDGIATSIRAESGAPQDVASFRDVLLARLEPWLDRFLAGGVGAIAAEWEARADLGRRVSTGTKTGTPIGLAPDGGLRLRLDGGGEATVIAGDVNEIGGAAVDPSS